MTHYPPSPKPTEESLAGWIASLSADERERQLHALAPTPKERAALEYQWRFWARPKQLEPAGDWVKWLILAGRGFGKSRTGAEWVRQRVDAGAQRITIVGRTSADVRDVMVEGESGILATAPPWNRPRYEPSKRRLTWPGGAQATTYSADEPDQMRGPQGDTAWADELAAWQYPDSWDQLLLGLRSERSGLKPRVCVTTTPRSTALVRSLLKDPSCAITRGSTFENQANMAPSFFDEVRRKYEGTRLGRQELYAEVLDDVEGALWSHGQIDMLRVAKAPDLMRIVVAIDPSVADPTSRTRAEAERLDEVGIVVVGLGTDGHGYVLDDRSGQMSPMQWAKTAITALRDWRADRIIAETNNGGAMIEGTLRSVWQSVPYRAVHASRGKLTRAEPIASLYEQGRVHHVGVHAKLEDQMCVWQPSMGEKSPDRMDALVWGLTEIMPLGQAVQRNLSNLPPG